MDQVSAATPLLVWGVLVLVVIIFMFVTFRGAWQVASPNEALIISGMGGGKGGRSFKIAVGQGSLVIPGFQTAKRLSLVLHEAQLRVDCVTVQGIPVTVQGVCIYKVAADPESITNAAQRFLGQEDTMESNIQTFGDGHLRSIVGKLTVEQLISDRAALTDQTREAMKVDMAALGLQCESLQIKEITDPTNYIQNLAKPHIAVRSESRAYRAGGRGSGRHDRRTTGERREGTGGLGVSRQAGPVRSGYGEGESNRRSSRPACRRSSTTECRR